MEFPALHVYSLQRLSERRSSNKVWWIFHHYMFRTCTLCLLTKTLKHSRASSAGNPYNQAVQKLVVSILDESPIVHLANSVVLVRVLIPIDVVLSQSGRFDILAVVSPLDNFHTIDCVIMLLVVLCAEFCLLNFIFGTMYDLLAFCPVLSFDPA